MSKLICLSKLFKLSGMNEYFDVIQLSFIKRLVCYWYVVQTTWWRLSVIIYMT